MIIAGAFCLLCTVVGLAVSYSSQLPTGAVIILCTGVLYFGVVAAQGILARLRRPSH
ncbi:hypothetical protein D1872_352280 [compost metagenome]